MEILSIANTLEEIKSIIGNMDKQYYSLPCSALDNNSIGKHVRHIIELFECLQNQYAFNYVNYDMRERNTELETNVASAILAIDRVINQLNKPDKALTMTACIGDSGNIQIQTNYYRELLYNFEHCIHHMALIKVALNMFGIPDTNPYFGYAPSTIQYLKSQS